MFIVEERYEHWSKDGKKWTNWFRASVHDTEEMAKEDMKSSKELSKSIDKATKLKHEFSVREMTQEETDEYNKPKEKAPKKKRK
jgi:hypothetical protein